MTYSVLIVDDSKLARMAVAKALTVEYGDWKRVEAANADEAIEAVKKASVDLALLDFNMPGRDGLTLAVELRELNPDLPIAIISANHQQEVIQRANKIGAKFLPKPLTPEALGTFMGGVVQKMKAAQK